MIPQIMKNTAVFLAVFLAGGDANGGPISSDPTEAEAIDALDKLVSGASYLLYCDDLSEEAYGHLYEKSGNAWFTVTSYYEEQSYFGFGLGGRYHSDNSPFYNGRLPTGGPCSLEKIHLAKAELLYALRFSERIVLQRYHKSKHESGEAHE